MEEVPIRLNYSAGGFFSSDSFANNAIPAARSSQTFQWNRWLLQLNDQFSYLPQTSLGFGGGTGLGFRRRWFRRAGNPGYRQ